MLFVEKGHPEKALALKQLVTLAANKNFLSLVF